ncbi:uncharacterized protein TRUGW13939_10471 [Talaromyces rugulosus]|uniref:PAC domain-containing protein n=1 Tax=Talaromyces rugulosus TaxID=121627 RepID=A0A7H8RA87_TALRU|nr:uncharacterized protein TRUGW13939_10471 [Talaromyces rugulosus]QKX63302.1 hypothetical protein TRUGW13939_10471 [Talaromyces rugulosus]
MDDAVNVPLPLRTASPEAQNQNQSLPYATSLHSFVNDDQSVDSENWQPEREQPPLRQQSNSYDDIYDRSNAASRASRGEIGLQEFPLPTSKPIPSHTSTVDLGRTSRAESINKAATKNKTLSGEQVHPPVEQLRRQLAEYELPLLQQANPNDGTFWDPIKEEDHPASFDLIAPIQESEAPLHSLEKQADLLFSTRHMLAILSNPQHLFKFREFLAAERSDSLEILMYYLSACKALKAIEYSNAVSQLLTNLSEIESSDQEIPATKNNKLEQQAENALNALVKDELPAFITFNCVSLVSNVVEQRVKGTLPAKFEGTSDALAEVFCLTDPSRRDNPIIFASEEFHRTTQYGMDYVLGRNCRFLQGPKTNKQSVRRIREAIEAGCQHSELFLNYRRDGSPFMNLLMCAPLCDSKGRVRYFIGAQIDVSGLVMGDAGMDSMKDVAREESIKPDGPEDVSANGVENSHFSGGVNGYHPYSVDGDNGHGHQFISDPLSTESVSPRKDGEARNNLLEFIELLSPSELAMVREHGSSIFQPVVPRRERPYWGHVRPRIMLKQPKQAPNHAGPDQMFKQPTLPGVYDNYLLVRPYPSLRILFTSPSLRIPGILQSPFFSRVGGSATVRDDLLRSFMDGRSVTARIRWISKYDMHGRSQSPGNRQIPSFAMALFRPSSPEYLDDGTVVCSGHLRVICDFCCTDYSPLDESPGDDSDPFAHSADEEQDEDGENSEDDDTESFDIPRPSYRFRNRVRRGEGKVIAEKFIPPSDFAAAAKPQELFSPALGINSIPVVRRFINRRDATQVLVFTDGACLNNGGTNPQAGCAFFFRPAQNGGEKEKGQRKKRDIPDQPPNTEGYVSFHLEKKGPFGDPSLQTSNRAELRAVIAALRFRVWNGEGFRSIVIATDSEYVAEGATTWVRTWLKNGWNGRAGPVKNKDLWQALLGEFERCHDNGLEVLFWRIPREQNTHADQWAKAGAGEEDVKDEFTDIVGALV